MTIVLLCNRFPPEPDGVGDYTWHLAGALAARGATVHVVCRAQAQTHAPPGVQVHGLPGKNGPAALPALVEAILHLQPDWVGVQYVPYAFQRHGLPFWLSRLPGRLRRGGAQVWVMFHEVHIRPDGLKSALIGALQRRIARALCASAEVCCTSNEFYRGLLRPFRSDVRLLPVGPNVLGEGEELRLFPDKKFILSTFGIRNHAELIGALEILDTQGWSVGLVICGESAFFQKRQKHPLVHATGYRPAAEIARWLRGSDLFVLPDFTGSNGEGGTCTKSGSLASAMAAGLPVLGIRGDMTAAPLEHGKNIFLAPDGSRQSLAAGIAALLADASLRQTLREGAGELIRQHMGWAAIAEGHYFLAQAPTPATPPPLPKYMDKNAPFLFKLVSTCLRLARHLRWRGRMLRDLHWPQFRWARQMPPVVQSGPFAGMRYGRFSTGSVVLPKLAGTYESELHPLFLSEAWARYDTCVDVGAGEGYYAVGLCFLYKNLRMIAFEQSAAGRWHMRRLATRNGVGTRLDIQKRCEPALLESALHRGQRTLLLMDVEGYEEILLDPEKVPSLQGVDFIVELHPERNPALEQIFHTRFGHSHRIEIIPQATTRRLPPALQLPAGLEHQKELVLNEFRGPQYWLSARALNASAS